MQSCVKTALGKVEMMDIPIPTPGLGEIVLKTTLATVCGSDMHFLDEFPNEILMFIYPSLAKRLPSLPGLPMGHEGVGTVHAVGESVTRFQPGERVIACWNVSCGKCLRCRTGDYAVCSSSECLFGTQSEYYMLPFAEVNATQVPDEVSDEQALLAADIMSTGFDAIERAKLEIGDSVAIFGQGPVGLCATAGARARGAGLVIAVESIPERIEASKKFGANVVINPKEKDAVPEIISLTNGQGVDVAVEAVGLQVTFEQANRAVRRGGTVSNVGVYGILPQVCMPTNAPSFYHRKTVTSLGLAGYNRLNHMLDIIRYGKVDLSALFTHRMKLSQTPEAYELFREKRDGVLKIAITP